MDVKFYSFNSHGSVSADYVIFTTGLEWHATTWPVRGDTSRMHQSIEDVPNAPSWSLLLPKQRAIRNIAIPGRRDMVLCCKPIRISNFKVQEMEST